MALAASMITSASRDSLMQSARTVKDMSVKDNGAGSQSNALGDFF